MLGEPWGFQKTKKPNFIISHPNKIFISRNKSLKKKREKEREESVSIAFPQRAEPWSHWSLAALGSAVTGANQARGHRQVPCRTVSSYNCLGPGVLGAGHICAMAVFLGAWLALGVGEGRVTLDWRWACHIEMGTEV